MMKKYKINKVTDINIQNKLLKKLNTYNESLKINKHQLETMLNISSESASIFSDSNLHKILYILFQEQNLIIQREGVSARLYFLECLGIYFYALTETDSEESCLGILLEQPYYNKYIVSRSKKKRYSRTIKIFCKTIHKLFCINKQILE